MDRWIDGWMDDPYPPLGSFFRNVGGHRSNSDNAERIWGRQRRKIKNLVIVAVSVVGGEMGGGRIFVPGSLFR